MANYKKASVVVLANATGTQTINSAASGVRLQWTEVADQTNYGPTLNHMSNNIFTAPYDGSPSTLTYLHACCRQHFTDLLPKSGFRKHGNCCSFRKMIFPISPFPAAFPTFLILSEYSAHLKI